MNLRAALIGLAALGAVAGSGVPAHAAEVSFVAVPTNWRLQSYTGGGVTLWYTPSTCTYGLLMLQGTAADHERLWSLVLSAKLSQRALNIAYDDATCFITSYAIDGP